MLKTTKHIELYFYGVTLKLLKYKLLFAKNEVLYEKMLFCGA